MLSVSVAGFYEHQAWQASGLWHGLLADGVRVGKGRVQKLMQFHRIFGKGKRRFNVTIDSAHDLPISSNLLDRQFAVAEPDKRQPTQYEHSWHASPLQKISP